MAKTFVTLYPLQTDTAITLEKVELVAYKHLRIKRDNDGTTELLEYDLKHLSVHNTYQSALYDSAVSYANHATDDPDELFITIANWSQDTEGQVPLHLEIDTYPATVWQAQNEPSTALTGVFLTPSDLPTAATALEQRQNAINAIRDVWRPQKRAWIQESLAYSDAYPGVNIPELVGAWLRAADRAIQLKFNDASLDQETLEDFVREMAKGALDVPNVLKFVESLEAYLALYPNGPSVPVAWVSIDTSTDPDTLTRQVLASPGNFMNDATLPADYNATDEEWLIPDTPGVVQLSHPLAAVSRPITATLVDPDGTSSLTWSWERQIAGQTTWSAIIGGSITNTGDQSTYTATGADYENSIRAVASYSDRYGSKTATSSPVECISGRVPVGTGALSVLATGDMERTISVSVTIPDNTATLEEVIWSWRTQPADAWDAVLVRTEAPFAYTFDATELPKYIRAQTYFRDASGQLLDTTTETQVLAATGDRTGEITITQITEAGQLDLIATLTDPDTVVSIQSYTWEQQQQGGTWTLTDPTRRVVGVLQSQVYRCTIVYTDWNGSGKTLTATHTVT